MDGRLLTKSASCKVQVPYLLSRTLGLHIADLALRTLLDENYLTLGRDGTRPKVTGSVKDLSKGNHGENIGGKACSTTY